MKENMSFSQQTKMILKKKIQADIGSIYDTDLTYTKKSSKNRKKNLKKAVVMAEILGKPKAYKRGIR